MRGELHHGWVGQAGEGGGALEPQVVGVHLSSVIAQPLIVVKVVQVTCCRGRVAGERREEREAFIKLSEVRRVHSIAPRSHSLASYTLHSELAKCDRLVARSA